MESVADSASSWPWFHLMNEAMEGRLSNSAPLLTPVTQEDDQFPDPAPRHRLRLSHPPAPPPPAAPSTDYVQEAFCDTSVEQNQRGPEACGCEGQLGGLEREWELVERERTTLERERELVERERASLERERATIQGERLWLERERATLERDRAMVEQERAALSRDREVLDQRAMMLNSVGHSTHLNGLM